MRSSAKSELGNPRSARVGNGRQRAHRGWERSFRKGYPKQEGIGPCPRTRATSRATATFLPSASPPLSPGVCPHVPLAMKGMNLIAKLEHSNPVGSLKDL